MEVACTTAHNGRVTDIARSKSKRYWPLFHQDGRRGLAELAVSLYESHVFQHSNRLWAFASDDDGHRLDLSPRGPISRHGSDWSRKRLGPCHLGSCRKMATASAVSYQYGLSTIFAVISTDRCNAPLPMQISPSRCVKLLDRNM